MNDFTINIAIKAVENLQPPVDAQQLTNLMHNIAASNLPFEKKKEYAVKIRDTLTEASISANAAEQVFKLISSMKGYL